MRSGRGEAITAGQVLNGFAGIAPAWQPGQGKYDGGVDRVGPWEYATMDGVGPGTDRNAPTAYPLRPECRGCPRHKAHVCFHASSPK